MTNPNLHAKLSDIQTKLNVPKNQFNKFGGFKYRSCEDILEAVKPYLKDLTLYLTDEPVLIGDRYYVRANATLTDGTATISVSAYARESLDKKGMDQAQVTGSSSSYARKYALQGLFLIDDGQDPDSDNSLPRPKTEAKKEAKAENVCERCGEAINNQNTIKVSKNNYGKTLCFKCQTIEKARKAIGDKK